MSVYGRYWSAWPSTQSDQNLSCVLSSYFRIQFLSCRQQILIRLGKSISLHHFVGLIMWQFKIYWNIAQKTYCPQKVVDIWILKLVENWDILWSVNYFNTIIKRRFMKLFALRVILRDGVGIKNSQNRLKFLHIHKLNYTKDVPLNFILSWFLFHKASIWYQRDTQERAKLKCAMIHQ